VHIIPVIDLLNGVVVHAKQGQRHQYQPIQSSLTTSTKPLDIVKAFRDIYPFDTLYIADLSAIQHLLGTPSNHRPIIDNILEAFPDLTIWIDAGIQQASDVQSWHHPTVKSIIGTENMRQMDDYLAIAQGYSEHIVLSLDFMPNGYQGPSALLQQHQAWPQDVIVMTLNQVGAQSGVDIATLNKVIRVANKQRIYAAGGVRNMQDLAQLSTMRIHGALIATALHSQHITGADLCALHSADTKKPE